MSIQLPEISEEFYEYFSNWDRSKVYEFTKGYRPLCLKIGRCFGFSPHDRDDFLQHCFVKVVEHKDGYDNNRPLWPWLSTFCWQEAHNFRRKISRRARLEGEAVDVASYPSATDGDVVQNLIRAESLDQVFLLIDTLRQGASAKSKGISSKTVEVGLLTTLGGMKSSEAAAATGISADNASVCKSRFLQAIRDRIPKTSELDLATQKLHEMEPEGDGDL